MSYSTCDLSFALGFVVYTMEAVQRSRAHVAVKIPFVLLCTRGISFHPVGYIATARLIAITTTCQRDRRKKLRWLKESLKKK